MSWENIRLDLKDVIKYGVGLITLVLFIGGLSSKVDNMAANFEEMKQDSKENRADDKLFNQNTINQMNLNTIQIKILEQRVKALEDKK